MCTIMLITLLADEDLSDLEERTREEKELVSSSKRERNSSSKKLFIEGKRKEEVNDKV